MSFWSFAESLEFAELSGKKRFLTSLIEPCPILTFFSVNVSSSRYSCFYGSYGSIYFSEFGSPTLVGQGYISQTHFNNCNNGSTDCGPPIFSRAGFYRITHVRQSTSQDKREQTIPLDVSPLVTPSLIASSRYSPLPNCSRHNSIFSEICNPISNYSHPPYPILPFF